MPSLKGQNETILLVEDEAALLVLSARALTLFGYRVLSAANGREALELWEQHQDAIDLVVTDMRMPKGISGLELAEKLWKIKPALKIIIVSGYSMEMVENSATAHVGYTFLAKPFDLKNVGGNCSPLPGLDRASLLPVLSPGGACMAILLAGCIIPIEWR